MDFLLLKSTPHIEFEKVYITDGRTDTTESRDAIASKNFALENYNEGIKMEITFRRRLTNELMTTYLPSFFLLGICYATTHFKAFYFEASVTVNLTTMLVATTLFIRFRSN